MSIVTLTSVIEISWVKFKTSLMPAGLLSGMAKPGALQIVAEVMSYFEFKDQKIFKIHGQVHLLKGNPYDVDMNQE